MSELYEQLEEYGSSDYYPFHMPGHKRNRESAKGNLAAAYSLDITEIDGFDNLHQAEGVLKREQERAARIYGAEKTYFLVNGSTGGILSAISAVLKKGSRILIARNCHKSVYHGIYLNELEVSYLYPEIIGMCGIAGEITPKSVEDELKGQPDIKAVMITSPTYEGIVSDVKKIADIAHKYGIPLIVDEAHGAHFGFHGDYPESSVKLGADIVIHSLHKTMPAITQTALLHVNGNLVHKQRLERYLRIFQTSSPSYVLMASISYCLDVMENEGMKRLGELKELRDGFIMDVERCSFIKAGVKEMQKTGLRICADPCKLVIYADYGRLTGRQLYEILRDKYHLQMEMAVGNYVLGILSMMDTQEGLDRLAHALLEIDKDISSGKIEAGSVIPAFYGFCEKSGSVMPICQAYDKEQETVKVEEAGGRTAAEFLNLYPPGIPLAVPGERLDKKMAEMLMAYEKAGFHVQGIEDGYVKVLKDNESTKRLKQEKITETEREFIVKEIEKDEKD